MYSDKYWEMFNEIDRDFDDMAIRTFKVSLPVEHDLRKSLTKIPVRSMGWLVDINGSRKTSSRGRGRLRLSLKIKGISGRTNITIISHEKILLGNLGLLLLRWLARCSRNQCIKSWK